VRFDGKVVVITGVGREGQLGETLASTFCEAGARVAAVDLMRDEVVARATALSDAGLHCEPFSCNLTDASQADALALELEQRYGGVDALVHAAGGFAMGGSVTEADPALWERMFAINLTSAYHATRALLPLMRRRGGAVVYFGSTAALEGGVSAGMAGYVAAKSGVISLMRTVAQEEAPHGVRANAIAPVAVRTAANLDSMGTEARYVEREEVAAVARFLCSADAARVTGQVVVMR
jgi:NAD(P)-dependent dehydrogenase (short-subunit alcohol dehydrogenase family)